MIIEYGIKFLNKNEYAKEGTKFLKTLDDYFKEFEKVVEYSINDLLRTKTPIPENIPDPIKIIDSLEMFFHTGAKTSLSSSIEGMALTDSAHFFDLTGKFQMMAFESCLRYGSIASHIAKCHVNARYGNVLARVIYEMESHILR